MEQILNPLKSIIMKVSKALLGAILVGIAVQTTATTSCTKKNENKIKPQTESKSNTTPTPENQNPDSCPACGMG
jgi:hypothetical protein